MTPKRVLTTRGGFCCKMRWHLEKQNHSITSTCKLQMDTLSFQRCALESRVFCYVTLRRVALIDSEAETRETECAAKAAAHVKEPRKMKH